MDFYGTLAEFQLAGDFLVRETLYEQQEHLALSRGEEFDCAMAPFVLICPGDLGDLCFLGSGSAAGYGGGT